MFIKIKKRCKVSNLLIFCLLSYFIIGCCSSESQESKTDAPSFLARIYSQEELDEILKVGMSHQDVIKIFGMPLFKDNEIFVYRVNFSQKISKDNKEAIIGFSVIFRNDKVERWHPAYADLASDARILVFPIQKQNSKKHEAYSTQKLNSKN